MCTRYRTQILHTRIAHKYRIPVPHTGIACNVLHDHFDNNKKIEEEEEEEDKVA